MVSQDITILMQMVLLLQVMRDWLIVLAILRNEVSKAPYKYGIPGEMVSQDYNFDANGAPATGNARLAYSPGDIKKRSVKVHTSK